MSSSTQKSVLEDDNTNNAKSSTSQSNLTTTPPKLSTTPPNLSTSPPKPTTSQSNLSTSPPKLLTTPPKLPPFGPPLTPPPPLRPPPSPTPSQKSNKDKVKEVVHVDKNPIKGQLAILMTKESKVTAIPMDLINKKGKITLAVDSTKYKRISWGAKYGHWVQKYSPQEASPELPLGLDVLSGINKIFVSEHYIARNEFLKRKKKRVYLLRNILGDLVLIAKERINLKIRFMYGLSRQTDLKLYDPFKREVLFFRQLLRFSNSLCLSFVQRMEVMTQPSKSIGTVTQNIRPFGAVYSVNDENNRTVLIVSSQRKMSFFMKDQEFDIHLGGNKVGEIRPSLPDDRIAGDNKELPVLSITFADDMNPINKSRLMAAMFLIMSLHFD